MKNQFKYIALGLVALSVSSCADLDTVPLGGSVTAEQRQEAIAAKPELGVAGVTAISASYNRVGAVSGESYHYDFGYASLMLGFDSQAADLYSAHYGYNWFSNWQGYTNPNSNNIPTAMAWYYMYETIKIANDVITTIGTEATDAESLFFAAQARANRAHCYWVLANLYQFNYQHAPEGPEALCVPIISDLNRDLVAAEGCPRSTVQEVYDFILEDLRIAIENLEAANIDPSSVIASKAKRLVSKAAAYGIRARVHLSMGKYAEAALDAESAIANFKGRPYTRDEVSRPAFNNIDETSWMWGIAVAETDRASTSGIINFPSHICSFAYGYVTVGAWRYCAKNLFESIPDTDVRKGWFLDENYESPNLSAEQQEYLWGYVDPNGSAPNYEEGQTWIYPYTNVKFDSYQSVLYQSTNASDIPLMRVEEMYYILAEAQANADLNTGIQTLVNFVKQYRNPKYSFTADAFADVQEEIFQQRRMELWGEGLIWFDYMRLNKGVDRRESASPNMYNYNIPAGSPELIYLVPYSEETANNQIPEVTPNNEPGVRPTPIPQ